MNFRDTIVSAVTSACLFSCFAQGPGAAPDLGDLKTYLTLTDSQVTALTTIQQQERRAIQQTMQDIQAKQAALATLLKTSTDAAAIGRAMLDIESLRKKIDTTRSSFHDQAVNALTAPQKTKLNALADAAKLQPAIHEAAMVNLLNPPAGAMGPQFGPRGFGGPGGPGGAGPLGRRMPPPPPEFE